MSRWNRPMRRYQPPKFYCGMCGRSLRPGDFGGWDHVERLTGSAWHPAKPVAA